MRRRASRLQGGPWRAPTCPSGGGAVGPRAARAGARCSARRASCGAAGHAACCRLLPPLLLRRARRAVATCGRGDAAPTGEPTCRCIACAALASYWGPCEALRACCVWLLRPPGATRCVRRAPQRRGAGRRSRRASGRRTCPARAVRRRSGAVREAARHQRPAACRAVRTLKWRMSRWPCSTALALLAYLSTRSLTVHCCVSPGRRRRLGGSTARRSCEGRTVASTAPLSVLVMLNVWLCTCGRVRAIGVVVLHLLDGGPSLCARGRRRA